MDGNTTLPSGTNEGHLRGPRILTALMWEYGARMDLGFFPMFADLISVAPAFGRDQWSLGDYSMALALPPISNLQFPLSGVEIGGVMSDSLICGIRRDFLLTFTSSFLRVPHASLEKFAAPGAESAPSNESTIFRRCGKEIVDTSAAGGLIAPSSWSTSTGNLSLSAACIQRRSSKSRGRRDPQL